MVTRALPPPSRARRAGRLLVALGLTLLLCPLSPGRAAAAEPEPAWGWPLGGTPTVDREFEPPRSEYGAGHRGVDLDGTPGQVVLSAGDGQVTYAGLLAGRGVVTVTHADGLRTTYEPVEAGVSVGDLVRRGDPIGTLDGGHASCRRSTACLHWGLLRGKTYLDPLSLVRRGQLRLLPRAGDGHEDDGHRHGRRSAKEKRTGKKVERSAEKQVERTLERDAARTAERAAERTVERAAARSALQVAGRLAAQAALRAAGTAAAAALAPEVLVGVGVVVGVAAVGYGAYSLARHLHLARRVHLPKRFHLW